MANNDKSKAGDKAAESTKDKTTSGGGKDENNGGLPAQQTTADGKGETSGSRGTSGS